MAMFETKYLWWGYKHTSGTYQAKRVFEHLIDADLEDAYASDFVESVCLPFMASGREEALAIVKSTLG